MAVKIRLKRTGATNDPSYRVVASDSRFPRDGRFLEALGWYDPKVEGKNMKLDLDRINYWISKGAQISDTVRSLVKQAGEEDVAAAPVEQPVAVAAEAPAVDEPAGEEKPDA